jgi:hypothetical protein
MVPKVIFFLCYSKEPLWGLLKKQKNRYQKLVDAVKTMLGVKTPIAIQTYMGKEIKNMSHQALLKAGELVIVNPSNGSAIIGSSIVEPPRSMATDKLRDVEKWHADTLVKGVISLVTKELADLELPQVEAAMIRDGKIHRAIANFIKSSVPDWPAFIETYARDDTAKAVNLTNNGEDAAMVIARGFLQQVAGAIRANASHIKTFFAQREAQQLTGKPIGDRPLFEQHIATSISKFSNVGAMWRELAEDAMLHGNTARLPVACLYNGHQRSCAEPTVPIRSAIPATIRMNQEHPFKRAHIDSPLASEQYAGDTERALDMYHLFSGRHLPSVKQTPTLPAISDRAMEMYKLYSGGTEEIGDDVKRGKNEKKKSALKQFFSRTGDEIDDLPKLVPISEAVSAPAFRPMPKLVPISEAVSESRPMPKLVPISEAVSAPAFRPMPKLVPISEAVSAPAFRPMPKLVPLSEAVSAPAFRPMPKLVPISEAVSESRPMPKLVPLSSEYCNDCETEAIGCACKKSSKKSVRVQGRLEALPKLVPIEEPVISYKDALLGAKAARMSKSRGPSTSRKTRGEQAHADSLDTRRVTSSIFTDNLPK